MQRKAQGTQQQQEYQIKPKQREKFRPSQAKEIINQVLEQKLKNLTYNDIQNVIKLVADEIKYKLKDLQLPRYKFMVNVIIGQQKGQGVRVGTRCFWDYDTDSMASQYYINDSLFCLVTVYGVYLY